MPKTKTKASSKMPTKATIKKTTRKTTKSRLALPQKFNARLALVLAGTLALLGIYVVYRSHASGLNFVSAQGNKLYLNGGEYKFTGVNAYHLTTDYSINYGCGENNTQADVDNFFSSLRPNSMVRVWAFQQIAWDKNTNSLDFAVMDRVVNSANAHNQKLILTLGDQWGTGCGEVRKTESWYASGYKSLLTPTDPVSMQTVQWSYWDYLDHIIPRYAGSASIGMWEPINEPASDDGNNNCSGTAAATLKTFFDSVGGKIHTLDPNHLVSSGLQGSGQCGTRGIEYQTLHQSPGVDIASYHDYGNDDQPMPGDQWNGLQVRLNQMAAIGKPLFVGEAGIRARDNVTGCLTTTARRDKFKAKMDTQFNAGIVGFIPWVWVKPNARVDCTSDYGYDIEQGQDTLLTLLHDYPLPGPITDTTAPTQPSSLTSSSQTATSINIVWSASSDNTGVTGYDVYRNGVKISAVSTASYNDTGLAPNTTYAYYIIARDAAGNSSPASSTINVATQASVPPSTDTTAPVVNISSPTNNASIGNSVSVKAIATDNVGTTKVQVYIDGSLKAQSTGSSITYMWNTKKIARGSHTITVKAYDAAGNVGQASVTVYR